MCMIVKFKLTSILSLGFMAIAGEGTLGPRLTPSWGEGGSHEGELGGSFTETGAGGCGGVPPGGRGYEYVH
jgi:hypothetical protein